MAGKKFRLDLPDEVRRFTNAELQAATRQMNKSLMLGMGGFGPVFRLVDKEQGKCAKVGISVASSRDGVGQGKEEFANEAKLLYLWQHHRIVRLMGVCEGPVPMIIYEHMSRGSLSSVISDDREASLFSATRRLQAAVDVAEALEFLHAGGLGPQPVNPRVEHAVVLHRDLNPSNILLDQDYRAKLGDFGLSAMLHEDDVRDDVVLSCEQVVGQWAWSSPEAQTTGNMPASDTYALGLIVIQLVFGVKDPTACRNSLNRGASSYEELPPPDQRLAKPPAQPDSEWQEAAVEPLVQICLHCTRHDPGTRPSARECFVTLSQILEMATGLVAPPPSPPPQPLGEWVRVCPEVLSQRQQQAETAGKRAPGCLLRVGGQFTGGGAGGQEAVANIVAVACCSEDDALQALVFCRGDGNAAVELLVSGKFEEVRRKAQASAGGGRGGRGGKGGRRGGGGGGSEPGRVHLPGGLGTGAGKVDFKDGSCFEGCWTDGECQGKGSYMNALGRYTGDFRDGWFHGKGHHVWRQGGVEYEGEWKWGQMHGKGILTKGSERFEITSEKGKLVTQKPLGGGGGRILPNTEEKEFMVESFVAVAACEDREAGEALAASGWDLQAAIKSFLSGHPARALFDGLPAVLGGGDEHGGDGGDEEAGMDEHGSEAGAQPWVQSGDEGAEAAAAKAAAAAAAAAAQASAAAGAAGHTQAGAASGGQAQENANTANYTQAVAAPAESQAAQTLRFHATDAAAAPASATPTVETQAAVATAAAVPERTAVADQGVQAAAALHAGWGGTSQAASLGGGEPELPPGWERRYDAGNKRYYYANHITKSTQWSIPVAPAATQGASDGAAASQSDGAAASQAAAQQAQAAAALQAHAQAEAAAAAAAARKQEDAMRREEEKRKLEDAMRREEEEKRKLEDQREQQEQERRREQEEDARREQEVLARDEAQASAQARSLAQQHAGGGEAGGAGGDSAAWGGGAVPANLEELLMRLALGKEVRDVLVEQEIADIETCSELGEDDFSEMGVPVESALALMRAVRAVRSRG